RTHTPYRGRGGRVVSLVLDGPCHHDIRAVGQRGTDTHRGVQMPPEHRMMVLYFGQTTPYSLGDCLPHTFVGVCLLAVSAIEIRGLAQLVQQCLDFRLDTHGTSEVMPLLTCLQLCAECC